MASFVDISEVRHHIMDRTVDDNDLDLDLAFTDEEILKAMERAARSFNALPPQVLMVEWNRMPLDTNIFLDATAEHLYRAALGKLRRNDIDYNAGGVSTNIAAKRISHYERMVPDYQKAWTEAAQAVKVTHNYSQAFRLFN